MAPFGARRKSPPPQWEDPMPKPERLNLDPKRLCGGLVDPVAPLCRTLSKFLGKEGLEVKWLRAAEFMPEKPSLFGEDGPSPMDIEQGEIGDCYFLASMSALAEVPSRIRSLFLQDSVNEEGVYCVLLMKNGKWHEVWVDDHFPTSKGKAVMCGSKNTCKLWPLLLEKAYACLYGGADYLNIGGGGLPSFSLHALTGAPTNQYDMRQHSREDLWDALASLESGRAVACAFCMKKPFGPAIMPASWRAGLINMRERLRCSRWTELLWVLGALCLQVLRGICCLPVLSCRLLELVQEKCAGPAGCSGIVDGHAYSVLAAMEVPAGHGTERIVKLRNPWGEGEWRGRYSDGSCAWTEEAMKLVDLEKADDGVFWMELSDFEAYFACTAFCYLLPECGNKALPSQGVPTGAFWHSTPFLLDLEASGVAKHAAKRCSCKLVVPTACNIVVTVDEFREAAERNDSADSSEAEDTDDQLASGFADHAWCLLVFDCGTGDLAENGCSKPAYRWMDLEWNARQDGGPFSEIASLSTEEMELEAGDYLLVLNWSPTTDAETLPKKVVCIVASSAPGASLQARAPARYESRGEDAWEIVEKLPLLKHTSRREPAA
eukprot:CAMPEP_0117586776 /NCGR_PEP_ID=MMETSP0784-20121206/68908_1 /TAXON_ID=39447 /ORGANISM="" /LENGTH=603 /DNA_ID=CAMNT_0005387911 /DNA_START=330 /DNA_END=2141 /DNA_ORIENTATION=-